MPVIETIQNQRRFLDEQLYIAQKFGANLRVWSDSIQALYRSVQLIEASSDLKGRLEVAVPNTEKANKLTWKDVFVIFSLFQLLFFVEDHAKPNVVYFINQISEFIQQHFPEDGHQNNHRVIKPPRPAVTHF